MPLVLPPELMLLIFEFLLEDGFDMILKCAFVSRYWYDCTLPHRFRQATVAIGPPRNQIHSKYGGASAYVPHAKIPNTLEAFLEYIKKSPINGYIRNLTLRVALAPSHEIAAHFGRRIKYHHHPYVDMETFWDVLDAIPQLEHLSLDGVIIRPGYNVEELLLKYCPRNLHSLHISYAHIDHVFTLDELLAPLTILNIVDNASLTGFRCVEGSKPLANPIQCNIVSLRISGKNMSQVFRSFMETAEHCLQSFRTLDIRQLVPHEIPALKRMIARMPYQVEELTLKFDCEHYEADDYTMFAVYFRILADCPQLETLSFRLPSREVWDKLWPVLTHILENVADSLADNAPLRTISFHIDFSLWTTMGIDDWEDWTPGTAVGAIAQLLNGECLSSVQRPLSRMRTLKAVRFLQADPTEQLDLLLQAYISFYVPRLCEQELVRFSAD